MKPQYFLFYIAIFLLSTCAYDPIPEVVDCTAQNITLTIDNVQATPCGTSQGSFRVLPNGPVENFTFSIDGSNFQNSNEFSGLPAGNYTVTAQSLGGCTAIAEATITDETNITISVSINDAGCGTNNGQIQANASQAGYEYSIDSINFQAEGNFTGLGAGTYTVIARNNAGCSVSEEVTLASGISYENTVANIITTNCSTEDNCHGADSPNATKLATLADIQELADRVKARVVAETMPPGDRDLTQEQIDLISCWIDDGALDN